MKNRIIGTLRFKLSWTHGIVISLALACAGLVSYQFISYRAQRAFDRNLLLDARLFVSHLSISGESYSVSTEGLTPPDVLTLEEFGSYLVISDLQGRAVLKDLYSKYVKEMLRRGELQGLLAEPSGFARLTATDGTKFRFVTLPAPGSSAASRYLIHLGRNTEQLDAVLNESLSLFFYSIPLMLVLAILVGWFLAGRALKPFDEVAQTAERLTWDNLNTRIVSRYEEREIQRLVQSFNSMIERLNRSFQQMRQFNSDVAHELRTPLAILQGENEVALRSTSLTEDVRSVLASNLEELERLTRVVNDLLTLAEADAGTEILQRKPVELRPMLEDLIEEMQPLVEDRNLRIECRSLPNLRVQADELWIRRALLNLIDNSIKYSRPGGIIELWLKQVDSMVQIGIRDHGIGIDPSDLPRIFDRLYRADPARTRTIGGSGLGLSIVKWIIEAHHGQISVNSQPELGTTIEILLPAVNP